MIANIQSEIVKWWIDLIYFIILGQEKFLTVLIIFNFNIVSMHSVSIDQGSSEKIWSAREFKSSMGT